jgi:hypothetical protein
VDPVVFPAYRNATAGISTGEHPTPPRSASPPRRRPYPPVSQGEFIRRLSETTYPRVSHEAFLKLLSE